MSDKGSEESCSRAFLGDIYSLMWTGKNINVVFLRTSGGKIEGAQLLRAEGLNSEPK